MVGVVKNEDLGNWFVATLNKEGSWNMEGPYVESLAKHQYNRQRVIMPNCPCKLVQMKVQEEFTPLILVA